MKLEIAVLALAFAFVAAAPAQEQEKEPEKVEKKSGSDGAKDDRMAQGMKRLADVQARLKMTPEQQEKVRPIVLDEMRQLKAVREEMQAGGQRPRDRMKAGRKLRSIQDDTETKLKPILSKEQMAEYKKIREERRSQIRERASAK